jgi:hypothetical protein
VKPGGRVAPAHLARHASWRRCRAFRNARRVGQSSPLENGPSCSGWKWTRVVRAPGCGAEPVGRSGAARALGCQVGSVVWVGVVPPRSLSLRRERWVSVDAREPKLGPLSLLVGRKAILDAALGRGILGARCRSRRWSWYARATLAGKRATTISCPTSSSRTPLATSTFTRGSAASAVRLTEDRMACAPGSPRFRRTSCISNRCSTRCGNRFRFPLGC